MGEWKAQLSVRVRQTLRVEIEEFAANQLFSLPAPVQFCLDSTGFAPILAPKFRPRSRARFLLSRSPNLQWGRIRRLLPSAPRHFRLIGKIAGRGERENALVALRKERPLKQATALVVEKVFVPAIFNERGYDHHDPPLRTLCGKLKGVLDERDDDETVGRREDGEVGWILTGFAEGSFDVAMPIILQQFGVLARLDVNGNDF